ncbi:MAG TPA: HEAT repeat domain-containing protein [Pirellulaceae bacterium]|jgi:tetratricopeptide (TPR) repeat protein
MRFARLGLLVTVVFFARVAGAEPTAGEVAKAVEDLSAAEFDVRQAATEVLWQAGQTAEEALTKAAKSTDPEVRTRAAALLKKLRLGIRPDTPAEVLVLIDQFRYSQNPEQRRQALNELQAKERWQTVLALIRGEQSQQERRNLATTIASQASKIVGPLVAKGELGQAEEVLELVATTETGLPQLTAFLILTDRLDQRIAAARERATEGDNEAWTRLAYLLRAKGDLPAATEAADKTSDLILRVNLRAEAGRWEEAAPLAEEFYRRNSSRLEGMAFATTFYRLAGNEADHQRTLAELLKTANVQRFKDLPPADKQPDPFGQPAANVAVNLLLTAAKTLFVNEHIDDGLAIMRRINPPLAHTVYRQRHRHREALEFVAVAPDKSLDRLWFGQLPTPLGLVPAQSDEYRMILAEQVARQLRELGRKEQVEQIWKIVRELPQPPGDRGRRQSLLSMFAWHLGRTEDAARYGAEAMAAGAAAANLFAVIARLEAPLALAWHERLTADDPQMDRAKAILLAASLVTPNPRRGGPPENWRELVAKARESVKDLPAKAKAERLVAFGQTCKIRGDLELARQLFLEAAEVYPASSSHVGDLAASEGDWKAAAKHYAAAAKANPADATVGYLLGHALTQAGEIEAGKKQLLLANLMVLAPEARFSLAKSFVDPSLKEEVVRQCELICRTALPDSQNTINAGQHIGSLVSTNEPRRSALLRQQILLHVLNPSANISENEGYLLLPHVIHKVLARAAIADRKFEMAETELARCEKLMPAEIRATIDLVPALTDAGNRQLADGLFERSLAVHKAVIDEFPDSATYLNNGAWLCARCQRELDEALNLAQRAVQLVPDEAAYQDTLAEVYFQRGDREAAVAAAQKCIDLVPANKMFADRLAHFRDDELKTLDKDAE